MSRVAIPGAKRVKDALVRMSKADDGNERYPETEKKAKMNYGTSDRVLRPRVEGNKVFKDPK